LKITVIGIATAYASISPSFRTPEWRVVRAAMFTAMGVSAIVPVFHGLFVFGYKPLNHYIGLNWLVAQGFLYLLGAGIYAARIPEKLRPGTFDIFLSSHQIFHFLVLAAATAHLQGLVKAFHSKHNGPYASFKVSGRRMKIA
jgi:adiponectin receptor